MQNRPVFFIAFQEQDNLGVGYIASALLQADFEIKIIDFRTEKEIILNEIKQHNPLVIGFSIIFQYHIFEFKELIGYLRENDVTCHFCAGGHYPSLRYGELLEIIPQLDSVVLFEGEHTFLELVRAIDVGDDWKQVTGIAFGENGSVIANSLRPLENNLDVFQPPIRPPLKEYALGRKYATLLAGRGCVYNCSYCSVRAFYATPPGPVKRMRRPEMVVREMELLHDRRGCSIFMFQDDDFPVAGKKAREWLENFCQLLISKKLNDKIMFKINCRPDEVDENIFVMMKKCGLFLVYLGIESGTDEGLRLMNKRMKVKTSLEAVACLKRLNISYDYGFMLFDPSSTFESIHENLDFLERICGDGSTPISFCKMLPYAETQVEHELSVQGRLKGTTGFLDYDFLDDRLNQLFPAITQCFWSWIMEHDGLLNLARWARYYLAVYEKYSPLDTEYYEIKRLTQKLTRESNLFLLSKLRGLCSYFEADAERRLNLESQEMIMKDVAARQSFYEKEFSKIHSDIESLAAGKSSAAASH